MLRGEVLRKWCEEGMRQKVDRRSVSVKVGGFAFTSTYMPVSVAGNEEDIEAAFEVLEQHVRWRSGDEVGVVGGDFNTHVGRNETRRGVCGMFGLRESNQQGERLLEWCEANSLTYVNSFFNHRKRGTWFSNFNRRWYELDGFLMMNRERQRHVKRVCTVGEMAFSDHKPKKMTLMLRKRKWRNA